MTFLIRVYVDNEPRNAVTIADSREVACENIAECFDVALSSIVWLRKLGEDESYVFPTLEE